MRDNANMLVCTAWKDEPGLQFVAGSRGDGPIDRRLPRDSIVRKDTVPALLEHAHTLLAIELENPIPLVREMQGGFRPDVPHEAAGVRQRLGVGEIRFTSVQLFIDQVTL